MESYLRDQVGSLQNDMYGDLVIIMVLVGTLIGALWTDEAAYWKGKYEVLDAIRVDYMPAPMGEALPEGIHAD